MPVFSIRPIDSIVYELRIDRVLKRIISLCEYERLKKDITDYVHLHINAPEYAQLVADESYKGLGQKNYCSIIIDLNQISSYLVLETHHYHEFEQLFLIGQNRIMIPLPENLALSNSATFQSPEESEMHESIGEARTKAIETGKETSKPLIYTYSNLSSYIGYWDKVDNFEKKQWSLFAQLSEEIIEVPYADQPLDYEYRFGKVAFHPNHGSAHAVRLVILFNKYLQLVESAPEGIFPVLSREEKACLTLAMFLFRSGRTNEVGWSGDPSYSKRSAAIFSYIAKDLGYRASLVAVIAQCFDVKARIPVHSGFYDKSVSDSEKSIFLYQKLFQLAHNSDLVRCHEQYESLKTEIEKALAILFACDVYNDLVDNYLLFAAQCCIVTGAPIAIKELRVKTNAPVTGNPYKMVHTTHNIVDTLETLTHMANTSLTNREANAPCFSSESSSSVSSSSVQSLFFSSQPNEEETEGKADLPKSALST